MVEGKVKHTICGLAEIGDLRDAQITHVLSILDPDTPEPDFSAFGALKDRLVLRFHNIIRPMPDQVLPQRSDMERILAFGRTVADGDPAHILIHCHMGISRSTAAATALLMQARPELDETEVVAQIRAGRPQAWPNWLMVGFADELLGRGGRLSAALPAVYREQLAAHRGLAEIMRGYGREAEVELGRAAA